MAVTIKIIITTIMRLRSTPLARVQRVEVKIHVLFTSELDRGQ
jgi:hypothetical protein